MLKNIIFEFELVEYRSEIRPFALNDSNQKENPLVRIGQGRPVDMFSLKAPFVNSTGHINVATMSQHDEIPRIKQNSKFIVLAFQ